MWKWLLLAGIVTTPLGPPVQRRAAGFIATFPQFVTWPKRVQLEDKILIGIVGENPIGEAGVDYLQEHGYAERLYEVKLFKRADADELSKMQILIVGKMPKKRLRKLLKQLAREPVLTVGTDPSFLTLGGMIQMNINLERRAVTWDVDLGYAKRAGLRVDPAIIKYGQTM